jgi:DNA-binding NarL/FixJ family response regulator
VKVAVIEPSEVIRTRVVLHLRESGIDVIATASSVLEAQHMLGSTRPDVVISEVMVGVLRGIELVDALRVLAPNARLVIFTNDTYFRAPCISRGVHAFLDKSTQLDQLVRALEPS